MNENSIDLRINKQALDSEWENQSSLMQEWCLTVADAQLAADQAKDALAVCEADMELDIRRNPLKYGIDKATEGTVKAAMVASIPREQAVAKYLQAKHTLATAQAVVQGLEHRKRALTCLTDLHLSGYFAAAPRRARGVRPVTTERDDNEPTS